PDLSGLPAFLSPHPGISSGYMMVQVMAASLVSENKILAHPASVDSIPTSANKEDHVSMGMTAALKLKSIVNNVESVLASEILAACQAMEFRKPLDPGEGTRNAYALVRRHIPALESDREVSPDLRTLARLIREKQFSRLLTAEIESHEPQPTLPDGKQ
ncbi:MAG: aromatic amino acid lyase, partial [Candidatus Binatia bacterium]